MKLTDQNFQSEEKLRKDLDRGSQDPQVYCCLADLVFSAGRAEEAISLYQQALNLPLTESQKGRLYVELGWLYYEIGRETQALPLAGVAADALSKELETPEVLAWRGAAESLRAHCIWFMDEKAGADAARFALQHLKKVMVEAPEFKDIVDVYTDAARLANLLGNFREAILFCDNSLRHDLTKRDRSQCLVMLAEALRHEEEFSKAENVLDEAFKLDKNDNRASPRLYLELGMIKRLTNRLDEAQQSFVQALNALESHPYLQDDPHFLTQIYGNLGETYYESGKYEEALTAFHKVTEIHPSDDIDRRNALVWLGQSYHATGNHAKARYCYEQVFESPLASAAEKVSVQSGLGKLCYDDGQYENAIAAFEAIIARTPEDDFHGNVLLWLGCSYEALALSTKARNCFETVLALQHASDSDTASAEEGLSRLSRSIKKTWQ